ncbi:MAG: cell envelope integrity protein TolA [Nitrosomonadales bacterium]|nr:cell envelope integrity protein TolA [Nitrosomonadales bacterium]
MSAAVYHEPYRLPAGLLALAVHGAFFALLYFGFTWQALPPATMSVELWHDLPDQAVAPPAPEKVEEAVLEEPVPPPKPEIALPAKKKPEPRPVAPKPQPKPVASKPVESRPDSSAADQQAAQAARERAEQAAAIGRVVDEYVARIVAKIRRNIVLPPGVANDARAEFAVTLLPGGTVLNARLLKSSGFDAYDDAVERAIIKSQPLPLPPDPAMFNRFRELKLGFKPAE